MPNQPTLATDSATELRPLLGDDATATFESDPKFRDSNPTESASSDNLEEQRPGAGEQFQAAAPSKSKLGTGPDKDEDDEFDDDEDEDEDDDDDEDDDLDDDDEDDDDLDDDDEEEDEDDLDDDDEDEDDEDEDDEEDDADELEASASPARDTVWADGLLGYEDEADDTSKKVDRVTGDVERRHEQARKMTDDPNEDVVADSHARVDPSAVHDERVDSNVVIRPVKPSSALSHASW